MSNSRTDELAGALFDRFGGVWAFPCEGCGRVVLGEAGQLCKHCEAPAVKPARRRTTKPRKAVA